MRPTLSVRPGRGVAASTALLSCLLFGCSGARPTQPFPALEPVPSRPLPLPDEHARPGDVQLEVADDWVHLQGLWTTYAISGGSTRASYRVNLAIKRNGPSYMQIPDLNCQAKLELLRAGSKTIHAFGSSFSLVKALWFAVGEGGHGASWRDHLNVTGSPNKIEKIEVSTTPWVSHSPCKKSNHVVLGISDEGEIVYYEMAPDKTPIAVGDLQRAREVAQ